jgi:hypothetical protein
MIPVFDSSSVLHHWSRPRTARAFTGYVVDDTRPKVSGLVVRFVPHTPIPLTLADCEATNQKRIMGTILAFPHLGFAKAPYKKPGKNAPAKRASVDVTQPAPLPLLEVVSRTGDGQAESVRVYNFHKANSNFDKGDRDNESTSELRIGQVLTFFLNEYTFDKDVFPAGLSGTIPAFTVVELVLNPSHNQSGGYGCKIARVKPCAHSLYSYMTAAALERLPANCEQAHKFSDDQAALCVPLLKCVERSRFSFYSPVSPLARVVDIREDLDFVRIENPDCDGTTPVPGVSSVDISLADLQNFTNCPGDVLSARTLVDLAIAAGALRLLVVYDDYYNRTEPALSQYRGVPLIDIEAFLAPVKAEELEGAPCTVFMTDWKVAHEMTLQKIALRVGIAPLSQPVGIKPAGGEVVTRPCVDLPLVSDACSFSCGYKIHVGNPGPIGAPAPRGDSSFYVLSVFYDAVPAVTAGGRGGGGSVTTYKRVRVDDEEEGETGSDNGTPDEA